jgi:hypothetical protein
VAVEPVVVTEGVTVTCGLAAPRDVASVVSAVWRLVARPASVGLVPPRYVEAADDSDSSDVTSAGVIEPVPVNRSETMRWAN